MTTTTPRDAAFAAGVVSDLLDRIAGLRDDVYSLLRDDYDRGRASASLWAAEAQLVNVQVMLEWRQKEVAK